MNVALLTGMFKYCLQISLHLLLIKTRYPHSLPSFFDQSQEDDVTQTSGATPTYRKNGKSPNDTQIIQITHKIQL